MTEPEQRPRFGPLRAIPPRAVAAAAGAAADVGWTANRFGTDGPFPNGGIWRVSADPFQVWVKRTGPHHLGQFRVWRGQFAEDDPHWWGREAAFYESDLATTGWSEGVRAAQCYAIDDHDDCRDLWLEDVTIPGPIAVCARASAGLAMWQMSNLDSKHSWLSDGWIPTHIRRQGLDNDRTLAHPGWSAAIARGLNPVVREAVEARVTDPVEISRRLQEFPQVLTHYDFHHANVGVADDDVVIIDWAYVGWGPIGHDAGHLALDIDVDLGRVEEVWHLLQTAYCDALVAAGWTGDVAQVRRSMEVSSVLRMGWAVDHMLNSLDQISDDAFAIMSSKLRFLAEMQ